MKPEEGSEEEEAIDAGDRSPVRNRSLAISVRKGAGRHSRFSSLSLSSL